MSTPSGRPTAQLPSPPSEWRAWLLACTVAAVGLAALVAVLTGLIGAAGTVAPPPLPLVAATPAPSRVPVTAGAGAQGAARAALVLRQAAGPGSVAARAAGAPRVPIATRWLEGFYPIYATSQATFGVDWLLLASIHMQETAFSTAPGTYHGLNFARCCGGPMQFNVTNGRVTTWDLVSNSYVYGRRPAAYDHATAAHPSIYDDFDAIMAAAHLLSANGASYALDATAWNAAYSYYGHDANGVAYADAVLARAIGWSQHGFCANCGVQPSLLAAVHAAYGAPVLAALAAAVPAHARATAARSRR